jgi:hypothetical protein
MKYMILLYGSQQDYDMLAGRTAPGKPAMSADEVAEMHEYVDIRPVLESVEELSVP